MLQLERGTVDEVGNDEDAVFLEHGVTGSVAVCGNRLHSAFESVASLEEMQTVLISSKHCLWQLGIVAIHNLPSLGLNTVDIYLCFRECHLAILQQTSDVVGMEMCDIYKLEFSGRYTQLLQFGKHLAEWCAKSGVEQYGLPLGLEQKAVHARRHSILKS